MEAKELREEYCKENGMNWIKPENTRAKDYVNWLEKRFANSNDKIKVAEEQLDALRAIEMIIGLGRPIKIDGDLHNKVKDLLDL